MKLRASTAAVALAVAFAMIGAGCSSGRANEGSQPTTEVTEAATDVPQFGDLPSPCREGSPSGTPDQAVDATSVTIGYGDDAGYQGLPGQGHEATDAVKAMIDWCNQQGGINGRQVKGIYYDARITEINNVMAEACTQTFMLVGQYYALPAGGEQTRLGCGLPTAPGLVAGADLGNSPLMVAASPNPVQWITMTGAAALAKEFPDKVARTGVMLPDFASSRDLTERFTGAAAAAGWTMTDCIEVHPISGVTDWRPYLQKLKDCNVGAVFTTNNGENLRNMLDAAAQMDYQPLWYSSAAVYTAGVAAGNVTGSGDNLFFPTFFVPIDDTPEGSANATYVKLVTDAGGDVSYGGQVSTSAFLLWATAADECGNELTRACVMENMKAIRSWTAGGLSAEVDPGGNQGSACQLVMRLQGPAWKQFLPDTPGEFVCDKAMIVKPNPPAQVEATLKLDANGVSQKYQVGGG